MDFLPEKILEYCENHSNGEPELLKTLNRETRAKVLNPRMLSGHLQGRFLAMISKMIQPERILEIGTFTGYSGLCLCEGLKPQGTLITIDCNDELEDFANGFFNRSAFAGQIRMLTGNALELLPDIMGPFDLVFLDADKSEYCKYYDAVIEKVRTGGVILADNVLWSGHVIENSDRHDPDTTGIREFNEMILRDRRVEVLMLPIRDGITMLMKKS